MTQLEIGTQSDVAARSGEERLAGSEEVEQFAVGESVEDRPALWSVGDQSTVLQAGEMARDIGLRAVEGLHKVGHPPFAVGEDLDDRESHRVAEAAKQLRRQLYVGAL